MGVQGLYPKGTGQTITHPPTDYGGDTPKDPTTGRLKEEEGLTHQLENSLGNQGDPVRAIVTGHTTQFHGGHIKLKNSFQKSSLVKPGFLTSPAKKDFGISQCDVSPKFSKSF